LKLEPNGQIMVNIVLYGGTVLYGVLRYGTVITVKKAEVRRISTSPVRSHGAQPVRGGGFEPGPWGSWCIPDRPRQGVERGLPWLR